MKFTRGERVATEMPFEFHHLDKFGYANLDLCEELLETEKKAVVLISGASSSGKSFSALYLKELLEENGHHALAISLDQYDYGLSGIIPNKVALKDFQNRLQNLPEIEKRIHDVIVDRPFDQKFDSASCLAIEKSIKPLLSPRDLSVFMSGIKREWKVLNFDEPSVYALSEAAEDIHALVAGKKVGEKKYSKIISERVPSDVVYDGKDYDVLIVEGIYALDPSFLDALKPLKVIKDFIDGNPKSLFLRRIIRDMKMTGSPSSFTVKIYFKYIIPAYLGTILPARQCADIILNNDISFKELRAGDLYVTRDTFPIAHPEAVALLKKEGQILSTADEKDFYFSAPNESQEYNNILRFRETSSDDGKTYLPSSLVHKGAPKARKDNKIVRPINVLLDEKEIGEVWKDEASCLKDFTEAGFVINRIEMKKKTRLLYHGQSLTLYEVSGRNSYLEFTGKYIPKADQEIRALIG
jgi:uridine kinase/adenylate cyclase class IV